MKCPTCNGSGRQLKSVWSDGEQTRLDSITETCDTCNGTGTIPDDDDNKDDGGDKPIGNSPFGGTIFNNLDNFFDMRIIPVLLAICATMFSCRLDAQIPSPPANFPAVSSNVSIGPWSVVCATDVADVFLGTDMQWAQVQDESGEKIISEPAHVYMLDLETVVAVSITDDTRYVKVNTRTGIAEICWGVYDITGRKPEGFSSVGK